MGWSFVWVSLKASFRVFMKIGFPIQGERRCFRGLVKVIITLFTTFSVSLIGVSGKWDPNGRVFSRD